MTACFMPASTLRSFRTPCAHGISMSRTVTYSSEESRAVCWFRRSHSSSSRNIRRSDHRAAASRVSPPVAAPAASFRGRSNVVVWRFVVGGGVSPYEFRNSRNISTGNELTRRRKPSHRDEACFLRAPSCKTTDFMALPKPPAVCSTPCANPARAPCTWGGSDPTATVTHDASKGGVAPAPFHFGRVQNQVHASVHFPSDQQLCSRPWLK